MTCTSQARSAAPEQVECRRDGAPDHEQSVVAQNHGFAIAEVGDQPLALADIVGDAFEVVVGDVEKPHRGLRQLGSSPHSIAETAMPAGVWVCATQSTSCRAM